MIEIFKFKAASDVMIIQGGSTLWTLCSAPGCHIFVMLHWCF